MKTKLVGSALAVALAALALSACDRTTAQNADREGAEIGRKANDALAQAEQKLKDAGHVASQKLSAAGQKTDQAISNAGANGGNARGTLGDTAITASIKTDFLKDPDLSVLKIDVDTKDGVVTLQGLAADEAARTRAEHIAQGVKGVREVRNYLVTKRA
jgi:hyperosmotically inducible protein